jgi:hypothetical protein
MTCCEQSTWLGAIKAPRGHSKCTLSNEQHAHNISVLIAVRVCSGRRSLFSPLMSPAIQMPFQSSDGYQLRRLLMWRWSLSGVRKLRDVFKSLLTFQQWNICQSRNKYSWKSTYLNELDVRKPYRWHLFYKEVKSWDFIQPGLEFDNFKPRLERGTFKCTTLLNDFFFGWWSTFFDGWSQDLSNSTNVVFVFVAFSLHARLNSMPPQRRTTPPTLGYWR